MRIFRACDSDPQLVKTVNALCPAPEILKLRIGAQVCFTKKLDVLLTIVTEEAGAQTRLMTENLCLEKALKFLLQLFVKFESVRLYYLDLSSLPWNI